MPLKLISLNVEKDTHLKRQRAFFEREAADVMCLQEVFEADYEDLRARTCAEGMFAPMCRTARADGHDDTLGSAIVSRLPLSDRRISSYRNGDAPLATYVWGETSQSVLKRTLLMTRIAIPGGESVRLATTHFTWSADAAPTAEQRCDVGQVMALLGDREPFVFCGDMNAPRGGEIFAGFAENCRDCIPSHYKTSLDAEFHYAGDLQLMVDGLFTSGHYEAHDVRLIGGVSDHLAIVADISCV